MFNFHVYVDGFCLHVASTIQQAKAFLSMMGNEGYGGYIVKVNTDTLEEELVNE